MSHGWRMEFSTCKKVARCYNFSCIDFVVDENNNNSELMQKLTNFSAMQIGAKLDLDPVSGADRSFIEK